MKREVKTYNIGEVTMTMETNGFPKGFKLKRKLKIDECRHILNVLLGINIQNEDECYDKEEYREYNREIKETVNDWLVGKTDDHAIAEFAYDCSDEQLGLFNMLPIVCYLKEIDVL